MKFFKIILLLLLTSFTGLNNDAQAGWLHGFDKFELELYDCIGFFVNSIKPLSDGGYLGSFQSMGCYCIYFFKTDSHGNILWMKKFENIHAGDVYEKEDGKIFLIGSHIYGLPSIGNWLMIFDQDGNIISQEFNSSGVFSQAAKIPGQNKWVFSGGSGDAFVLYDFGTNRILDSKSYVDDSGNFFVPYQWGNLAIVNDGILVVGEILDASSSYMFSTVAKLDFEGNVIWAKSYDETFESVLFCSLSISPLSDGGFLVFDPPFYYNSDTKLLRMDSNGNIMWEERLFISDDISKLGLLIDGLKELEDGTIIIKGQVQFEEYRELSFKPFIAALNQSGEPLWCKVYNGNLYIPHSHPSQNTFIETNGSLIFLGNINGDCEVDVDPPFFVPAMVSIEKTGNSSLLCYTSKDVPIEREILTPCKTDDINLISCEIELLPGEQISAEVKDLNISDDVICGDKFPGIISIQKLSSPFRLKLTGWNFEKGCKVYINGEKVGSVEYKGKDKTNRTKIVLSGSNLKKKLPKGERVCIQVINPDGNQSDCFYFTR